MSTKCYSMVRGSAIRVTALDGRGRFGDPIVFATSKAVARIGISEVVDSAQISTESNPDEEARLRFIRPARTIRNVVDLRFTCVDPALYRLITSGIPASALPTGGDIFGFDEGPFGEGPFGGEGVVEETGGGFGEGAFGEMPLGMGGSSTAPEAEINGIEFDTRTLPVSFALEVWSKLAGQNCVAGERQWGYTLFQHLRGGRISDFAFTNGLVSFNITGAQSRRSGEWGVGPYDLEGAYERMTSPVSRNNAFRQFITTAQPPTGVVGLQTRTDIISNGTPSNPMPDPSAPLVLSGGGVITSPYTISGGRP